MSIRTVAVLGAGHGGLAVAADLAARGFAVRLQGRRPERLAAIREQGGIEAGGVLTGRFPVAHLTTDVAEAVTGADLIVLVVPSVAHAGYARALAPLLSPERPLFLDPGHTGGGLHVLAELRAAGCRHPVTLGESVTLTHLCRTTGPAAVTIHGRTRRLGFAALPATATADLCRRLHPLFPELTPCSSVLETGFANINAIFHPPGMLMNAGWIEHTGGNFLFYREAMTPAVGRVVAAVDEERLAIARALGIPASPFVDIFHRLGLTTDAARADGDISRACRDSEPNRTVQSPPSLDHRYIHEDVGFGLSAFSAFGQLAGVPTPTIDALIHLASLANGRDYRTEGLSLARLGLGGRTPAEVLRLAETGGDDGR